MSPDRDPEPGIESGPGLRLRPMTPDGFAAFRARAMAGYAESQVGAGNWRADEAPALAERSFDELLPGGPDTDGVLLRVAELADGTEVGVVWVAMEGPFAAGEAWVYDIEIAEAHRGRGYGRALLAAAEREVADRGITRLGLNVFGGNAVALSLYESAGYETVSRHMRKPLRP